MEVAVIWVAIAGLCYVLAKEKGRDTTLALCLGILFGVFALMGYLLCSPTDEVKLEKAEKIVKKLS